MLFWDVLTAVVVVIAQDAAYEPKTLIGLLGLLIIAVPALAAGIPGWINLWRNRSVPSQVAEVRDQVQNSHPENRNLRDDIDRVLDQHQQVLDALKDIRDRQEHQGSDIRGLRQDIGQLRGEGRDERAARLLADSQIDATVGRIREQLDRPRGNRPRDDDSD